MENVLTKLKISLTHDNAKNQKQSKKDRLEHFEMLSVKSSSELLSVPVTKCDCNNVTPADWL